MLVNSRPSRIVSHRPELQPVAVAVDQRMVRPGDGRARAQQDQGVEQREAPRVQHLDALGRPLPADRSTARREQRAVEERPEPGEEEHHLRGDEQDHPVAQVKLDDRRVIAGVRLADGVRPPVVHGDQHAERSRAAMTRHAVAVVVQPHHRAAEQQRRRRSRRSAATDRALRDDNRGSSSRPCRRSFPRSRLARL